MATLLVGALALAPAVAAPAPGAIAAPVANVDRIGGSDRFATAVRVSETAFAGPVPVVFIANGLDYPDALSAAPVAAALGGPLLLTLPRTLPDLVVNELRRLAPETVVLVGSEAVVGAEVEAQVQALGLTTDRVAGPDRYATSRALIERYALPGSTLFIATGRNYPDALAAAAAAGAIDAPVLLVNGRTTALDPATAALIEARGTTTVHIAGSAGVVSAELELELSQRVGTVSRLAGRDRYETAVAIASATASEAGRAFVATGAGFADALSGAVLAAVEQAPLYLSGPTCLPRVAREAIVDRQNAERVTLLGSEGVLGPRVAALEACTTVADDRAASVAELTASLQLALRSLPGRYAVTVREHDGLETRVSINGAVVQEPVSVIKVFVAYGVLDRVDRGQLALSTATRSGVSVADCLRVMIHTSDNLCHYDLVALLGPQALTTQLQAEGYRGTRYGGAAGTTVPYSEKTSTTDDLALLLERLEEGELLGPELTEHFMTLLETQLWRSKLPAGVERGVPVGNKTGSAWAPGGWFHSDAGIVSSPAGTYSIAVLGSQGATAAGVRTLGRVVFEHFNGPIGVAASYSDLNAVTTGSVTTYRYANTTEPVGTLAAGTRVEVYGSARTWYQLALPSGLVWVPSSALRNAHDYPRSTR